jgi:hypothetical protein
MTSCKTSPPQVFSRGFREAVPTGVDVDSSVTSKAVSLEADWDPAFNTLLDLGLGGDQDSPDRAVIASAFRFAVRMREQLISPPDHIKTDVNGTVILEWGAGGAFAIAYYFWDDGEVEQFVFEDTKIKSRTPLPEALYAQY